MEVVTSLRQPFVETMEGINATPIDLLKEDNVLVSFPPNIEQLIVLAKEGLQLTYLIGFLLGKD